MNDETDETIEVEGRSQFGEAAGGAKTVRRPKLSPEMEEFYRVLALTQANAVYRVFSRKTEKERNEQAVLETKRLLKLTLAGKCKAPQVFNEITGRCE